MSKKTSREIALERRKAMSDSGKKAAAYSSTTKDRVRSSQDIQISGTQSSPLILTIFLNQLQIIFQKLS